MSSVYGLKKEVGDFVSGSLLSRSDPLTQSQGLHRCKFQK